MIEYTVKKNEYEEFVVRFHLDGKFQEAWTCYESSRQAARDSAERTIELYESSPIITKIEGMHADISGDVI